MSIQLVLAINPGSTSTKIAVYDGTNRILEQSISHSTDELGQFADMMDQYAFREKHVLEELEKDNIDLHDIRIIVARGGLLRPVPSGIYRINETMKDDLREGAASTQHASNLGGLIADALAADIDEAEAFVADPPVVDEMDEVARLAGHPLFRRKPIFHALNQKAIARKHARETGRPYEELNLIVAHMGGGISVAAHRGGRIIDVNNALDGEGPFSPDRSGTLPMGDMIKLCFSGKYTIKEVKKMMVGQGGIMAYLGTGDVREVIEKINNGDEEAALVLDAMIYQVAKAIGAMSTVLEGTVDGIILTGGIAFNQVVTDTIKKRVGTLGQVYVYPGEDEMEALAMNGLMVLNGEIEAHEY